MRELKINGVSFNTDYWATQTREDFVNKHLNLWPGLDEEEKKNLLIRVWPYIIDNEPGRNDPAPGTAEHPGSD